MLLTLMGNLGMFGGVVPPIPTNKSGDSNLLDSLNVRGGGLFINTELDKEEEIRKRKEILEMEDEGVIYQIISFVICQD